MADPTSKINSTESQKRSLFYPLDLYGPQNNKSIMFTVYKYRKTNVEEAEKRQALTSLALPIPNEISQADAMSYADFEGGIMARQMGNIGANWGKFKNSWSLSGKASAALDAAKGLGGDLLFSAGSALLGDEFKFLESNLGYTLNPKVGSVFQQVGLRTYDYSFMMIATNQQESDVIYDMVRTFQFYEHPGDNGIFFDFPEVFDISFTPQKIQNYLFKPNICALTGMTVAYNGSSTPVFFKDSGAPVEVSMQLQFKELQIDTKQSLEKKYKLGMLEESGSESSVTQEQTTITN